MNRENLMQVNRVYCRVSDMAVSLSITTRPVNVDQQACRGGSDDRRLMYTEADAYQFGYQLLCASDGTDHTLRHDEEVRACVISQIEQKQISTEVNLPTEYRMPPAFHIVVAILQHITGRTFDQIVDKGEGDWLLCGN